MITTKITGLSAQGADEYKGLAYSNNDVAITIASDNAANDGFKYVFNVIDGLLGNSYKFYVAPNHQLNGVFNAKTILNQLVPTPMVVNNNILIHTSAPFNSVEINTNAIQIQCWEGWKIGGVFTEDTTYLKQYDLMVVYGSGKQNFIVMGTNDTLPLALSQNYDSTLGFNDGTINSSLNLPSALQSQTINWQKISRSNVSGEQDSAYNIMTWIADNGTYLNSNYPMMSMNYIDFNLYDSAGSLLTNFVIAYTAMGGALFFLPTGLKNLVNGGYIDQTTANNTSYWTLEGKNGDDVVVTAKYGFYIDEDCKYNPVHLYWLNQLGGIDSYSFIKKNERSIEVEKKRYKQYLGDYNNATTEHPFETLSYSRSLTEREPIVRTYLNVQSDWISESEFKFMKDLFRSKSVWMVDDNVDGYSVVPVVVEDTSYLMRRERNSRKYNQTLRLQIANDNETLNTTASEFPIPQPVACTYYTNFAKVGGSSSLTIGSNFGNACNIISTASTSGRYITVSVTDGGSGTPQAGETYYVKIDYTSNVPTPIRGGYIDLGNTITGGGTRTNFTMQSSGTSIIATGIWGTGTTPSSFYIKLPTWASGGGTWTGNIYVSIGFGNCP